MPASTCIWCLNFTDDTDDTDVEHIFPDSLGCPEHLVLPGSVVCKRCNNGLAHLDQAVADEFDLSALLHGVPRKGGRPAVVLNRGNVYGWQSQTGPQLHFNLESHPVESVDGRRIAAYRGKPRDIRAAFSKEGPKGRLQFDVAFGQSKKFVPGIVKTAFNCLAFLLGADEARQSGFRDIRDFVLRGIGNRSVLVSFSNDEDFKLEAHPPFKASHGYCIELRIGSAKFVVDLSNGEALLPVIKAKALEQYGNNGWLLLPVEHQ
jgi:hypothetical protein